MDLPPPSSPRKKLHTRTIVCEGYEREDGLYDVEASIVDTKTYPVHLHRIGQLEPGSPMHHMTLRLTVDRDKTVRDIEVATHAAPHRDCYTVAAAYKDLIGASLASGWRKSVSEAVGGTRGCTHLKELLGPAATVAFQTMSGGQEELHRMRGQPKEFVVKPHFIDGCKAWASTGEAVKELVPAFYVPPPAGPKPD